MLCRWRGKSHLSTCCRLIMFKSLFFSVFLCVSAVGETIPLSENFLVALRKTESLGAPNLGVGAVGRQGELGPYQITKAYWTDAKHFDKSIMGPFRNCAQKEYSERVVTAYLNRYALNGCINKDYRWLAEVHNCGPTKRWVSEVYWNRFQSFLTK